MACELQQVGGTGDTAALSSLTLGMAPQGWTGSAPLLEGDLEASPAALSLCWLQGLQSMAQRHSEILLQVCVPSAGIVPT